MDEKQQIEKQDKLLYDRILLPTMYRDARLSLIKTNSPHTQKAKVEDWFYNITDKMNGCNAYIFGPYRSGKSSCAAIIAKAALAHGIFSLWVNFNDLQSISIDRKNHMFDDSISIMDKMKEVDLLIIDEMQVEANKKWPLQVLEDVYRSRYQQLKPTIITTNITPEQLVRSADTAWMTKGLAAVLKEGAEFIFING